MSFVFLIPKPFFEFQFSCIFSKGIPTAFFKISFKPCRNFLSEKEFSNVFKNYMFEKPVAAHSAKKSSFFYFRSFPAKIRRGREGSEIDVFPKKCRQLFWNLLTNLVVTFFLENPFRKCFKKIWLKSLWCPILLKNLRFLIFGVFG